MISWGEGAFRESPIGGSKAPFYPTDDNATRTRSPVQVWLAAPKNARAIPSIFCIQTEAQARFGISSHLRVRISSRAEPLYIITARAVHKMLRFDDMQYFVLMICTIIDRDDIRAYA